MKKAQNCSAWVYQISYYFFLCGALFDLSKLCRVFICIQMIVWGNKVFSLNSLQIGYSHEIIRLHFLWFWLVVTIIEFFSL